ncbi:MFS transporter [Microbacterium oxydans]|uniref:Enterobactin exporter EntS n=1 Tax=Microbacterium oxydans TaxID=82380 RepID=A0A0F0LHB3_9MICO|nr:MFS transporter [Microbacterium oxydans]KJL32049.1 enterobactin exporter EntS [Microbacterium oxydans]
MSTAPVSTAIPPHRLWRNARYVTWLVSDTSKGLAGALFAFAVPLLALILTNDPAQAGIIGGAGMVARLLTTLVGGILADRHPRIALMLIGSIAGVVLAGVFTALALSGSLTFPILLLLNILLAARSGLFDVAGESAIKEIVPEDAMGRAQAANQGRDAALQLAGGPLGGLLLGVGGWLVGVVMTLCHVVAAVTAWLLGRRAEPASAPTATAAAVRPNAWREMREGFAWLLSRSDLGGVLLLTTIINLGFNSAIITVIYALQQDGYSELLIGTVSAAAGVAMLIGAFVAPLLVPRVGAGVLAIVGLAAAAAGAAALSTVTEPWAVAVVLGAAVLLLPSLNAGMMGYFMVATPTHLLGRANSAAGVLGMGAMPLAPLIAGFGLTLVGRQATILGCAALCLLAAGLAVGNRALRGLPVESRWAEHARQYEVR